MAIQDFVAVSVSISNATSPTVIGLNTGLVAGWHVVYPDRVRVYSTAGALQQMVTDGFLTTSPIYKAVAKYASAPNAPALVCVGRRAFPPQQTLTLSCVDGAVSDSYDFSVIGSDGISHAVHYVNAINPGPAIPGTALTGTVTVTFGSTTVTFSGAQTLTAGQLVTFSAQAGVSYAIAASTVASTTATLTTAFTGTSGAGGTTTPGATTLVTSGSTTVTFSQNQTLTIGTLLTFSSQPGVYYALAAAVATATTGTLTVAYGGNTTAAAQTQALPSLAGTLGVVNGSPIVSTTSTQVGTVIPGDSVMFVSQPGSYYAVLSVTSTTITLTSSYSGVTNASTKAADVCTIAAAATAIQVALAGMTHIGTATVAANVVTLSRTDGGLNDIQGWCSNGFASIQLANTTADPGLTADLAAIRAANNAAWYGLILDSNSAAEIEAAASWAESTGVGGKFLFADNSDFANTVVSTTTDVFSVLRALSYKRTHLEQNDSSVLSYAGAAMCGQLLAMNPGSYTAAYKTLPGVPADSDTTLTEGQALALNTQTAANPGSGGKWGNYYKTQAGQNWTFPGVTPSGQYVDLTIGIDWLQTHMQADVAAVLAGLPKLPFTDNGIALIRNAIDSRLRLASTPAYGLILPDGQDPARPISVIVPAASAVSPTDRGNRNLPNVSWSAGLAGAILTTSIFGTLLP